MKKILLAMLMLLFAVSCGSGPEKTVSKFIDNIKAEKIKEAAKYAVDDNFEGNLDLTYNNKIQELLFKTLLKNINYKIIKTEKQDEETTVVTIEVENVDTQKVFLQIFQKMMQGTFSKEGTKKSTSVEEELKKQLEAKDKPKTKNTTQFIVKKMKDGEKILVTSENIDVLLGKLNTTLSNLGSLGKEEETAVELPETGPSTGAMQKPEELRNENK